MIAHTSGACVQSLANSPRPKKRDDSLLVPSPHQHLYDNQPVKGLVMDTQVSPAIPSGLTVIHPARRKSSAAVRRNANRLNGHVLRTAAVRLRARLNRSQ